MQQEVRLIWLCILALSISDRPWTIPQCTFHNKSKNSSQNLFKPLWTFQLPIPSCLLATSSVPVPPHPPPLCIHDAYTEADINANTTALNTAAPTTTDAAPPSSCRRMGSWQDKCRTCGTRPPSYTSWARHLSWVICLADGKTSDDLQLSTHPPTLCLQCFCVEHMYYIRGNWCYSSKVERRPSCYAAPRVWVSGSFGVTLGVERTLWEMNTSTHK